MKKQIIVFFICFIMLITSYPQEKNINKEIINNQNEEIKQKVDIIYEDEVVNLDLEEYVTGVVACEMPASFEIEALKAMAVAARTYALYKIETNSNYKLSTTTKDQCYITIDSMKKKWGNDYDKYYNRIKTSVEDTKNEKMTYNNKTIIAFYFSISNGYTENCENVFSQKLDYLKSVDSKWDSNYSYKEKTVEFDEKDFLNKLGISDDRIKSIDIDRSSTNRVNCITINGKEYRGTRFRSLLGLRSTDFEITNDNSKVYINTKGYGHGVGMSQYGANEMAKNGFTYDEILKYYYTGIEINV